LNLPFEARIALRYTRAGRRARRRNGFISFISAISMAGIALGVAVLIIVLSVVNGFEKEVRDRMLSVLAHIEIFSFEHALPDWRRVAAQASKHPEVSAVAPYVLAQAMFISGDTVRGVLLRGIDPALEANVSDVVRDLRGGALSDLAEGEFGVVLGTELARGLSVTPGDKLTLIVPQRSATTATLAPQRQLLRVVATFESGHFEFDSTLAMIHIADAQRIFAIEGPFGVRLRIKDMQQAPRVATQLAGLMERGLAVRDWTRQNRVWFAAAQASKRMMFIILILIIAVAAFNLVSTLVMTVTEKQADIAILRTLGASPRSVLLVFMLQGALIGIFGTLLGVAGGLLIANNIDVLVPAMERVLGVRFLAKDIYFISALPSEPRASDVIPVAVISLGLALIATLYPSWRAARTRPAEALRHE
jgi:lipoprotein-releasing system permease protein